MERIKDRVLIRYFFILAIFFLSIFFNNPGTQAEIVKKGEDRPKIGLVLGGGGARGAAHVGVLKVLEESRVPIDYIVGTSMGSVVGGLYASGYSPEEIGTLLSEVDWQDMFSDRPKENMLSFRNKEDLQRLAAFELGLKKGKIVFPAGIIAGQKLSFMLQKLTLHTIGIDHFDDLKIPYRAVAADAVTGEEVVFDRGNLGEAIRSSMSVPGAFPPVKVGGRLLIDGGLVKNVPVETAKEMGADIIIAVDVGSPMLKEEELNSLIDVTNQMLNILFMQNVEESLALLTDKDLLIRPELGEITSSDFMRAPEAIKLGEEGARESIDKIRRYSVGETDYKHYIAFKRKATEKPIKVDFVKVKKPARVHPKMIKERIKTKPGDELDIDKLEEDLTQVYAIGDFETVDFKIIEEEGKHGLFIDTKEKKWGPDYLRFGLNLHSDSEGANDYNLLLDYRKTQVNKYGAEWKVVGQVGQSQGVFTEFYQPLNLENYFFVAPHFGYERSIKDVYEGEYRIAEYRVDQLGGGIDVGMNFRSYAEARAGIISSVINAEPEVGETSLPDFSDINRAGFTGKIDYDQLDDHKFPTEGFKGEVNLFVSEEGLGADEKYKKLDFIFYKVRTYKDKHTFLVNINGGVSLDDNTPFYDEYTLGGFLSLSGLGRDQLWAKNVGSGKLLYYYKLAEMEGFASRIYLGASMEAGNAWDDKNDFGSHPILGGSIFLGIDTVLGPLYVAYGQAEGNDGKAYLFLGQTF
ncbi:patatin-like phospholipase family protein [Candidatus Omnitrophota bacterium]